MGGGTIYRDGQLGNEQVWGKSIFISFNLMVSATLAGSPFIISFS